MSRLAAAQIDVPDDLTAHGRIREVVMARSGVWTSDAVLIPTACAHVIVLTTDG